MGEKVTFVQELWGCPLPPPPFAVGGLACLYHCG